MKKSFLIGIMALVVVMTLFINFKVMAATDSTPPTVTISGISSDLVIEEGGSLTFKIYFDDETELASTYVVANSITLNGFTATKNITGGTVKTVTLTNIQGAGTSKSITIKAGAATDVAGNTSKEATSRSFTIKAVDTTVPTVTISKANPTSVYIGENVTYTVYFEDNIGVNKVNFTKDYVTLNGFTATVSVSGSGTSQRTVTLTNVQGAADGENYITVKAGAVKDAAGNTSKAATSSKFTMSAKPVLDTTVPTVTISKADPTSVYIGEDVRYTVYFEDNIGVNKVNFTKDYVILNGFTATVSVSGSGNTRIVTLTNVQGAADGENYITVKAGAVKDAAGNTSKAATSSKFTMSKAPDTTIPTVTISKANPTSVYIGENVTYTVYFDDETGVDIVNFTKDYVTLNGFTATVSVSGSGKAQRTVTLTNVQGAADGENYITVKAGAVKDAAGNTSKAATSSKFTMEKVPDTTIPTVTISNASPMSVYPGDTVTYTVYFDDETAIGKVNFNKDYVTLNGFTATVSVSGSGTSQRTVTLTNVQGAIDSDNYITVKAGAVADTTGNLSKSAVSSKFTIAKVPDTTIPTVTISKPNPTSVYIGGNVTYTVYFDDETAIGTMNFNKDYVVLHGFTATVSVSGSGTSQRTVTLTNVQGAADADNYITVKAGAVADTSGNLSKEATSSKFTMEKVPDTTIPTVTISKPNPTSVYIGGNVTYTVYFDDETAIGKVNFNKDYVELHGFTATVSVSGSGTSQRTVTLTNVQGAADADNYITVKAGAVADTSDNLSKEVTSSKFTMEKVPDTTVPTVTISKPTPSSIYPKETVTYTVYFHDETAIRAVTFNRYYVELHGFTATVSVSGSGTSQRTVTLTNIQGAADADNYITVKAGAVTDTSGNVSKAVNSTTFEIKEIPDTTAPTLNIDKANPASIYAGETVKYIVRFSDETKLGTIHFDSSYVVLNGFDATITVTGSGETRTVVLTNIQGVADSNNYITVKAGAAEDAAGNKTKATNSLVFTIKEKQVNKDTIPPVVKISEASPKELYVGGTVTYTATFTDNIKVTDINFDSTKVELIGFTADVSVKVDGTKSAVITLKNIKGNAGQHKYIKIASGIALDEPGNRSAKVVSPKFVLKEKETITKPTVTKYTINCIDDLKLIGDINKEITYFASWLRAEKYTASYVQENNYAAEDETITYMVEYYNGNTTAAHNVSFDLTIPYKVDVEEINGNGKVTKRTDDETVITWYIGSVPSYAASQGGYCRLYVRVKFLENEKLEKSNEISEVFYATLKTTADDNNTYSYMRQLFIDTTEGKTGTYDRYLTTVDTINQVRPDDEITRAEFAKLLADSGLLEVKAGSKDYKEFKDYELIPAYARDAVSALVGTEIMNNFPDGEFKPNNPILMEDAMQILSQVAAYISKEKLTVYKPVFVYTDALIGRDEKVSPKKDYIMELMRQNVVVKYESNPDTYTLRKDAVEMVNSLTFRGPYVETLPEYTLKFADIRNNSVFFYNIVGATNSYTYTYDYRLWQQIVEIEN